jgi:hypothetical protein
MDYWTRLNVEESSRVAKTNWRAKEGKKKHTHTHTHKANERTNALGGTRKKKWRESWRTRRARLFDSLKRGGQVYANFVFLVCECVCERRPFTEREPEKSKSNSNSNNNRWENDLKKKTKK